MRSEPSWPQHLYGVDCASKLWLWSMAQFVNDMDMDHCFFGCLTSKGPSTPHLRSVAHAQTIRKAFLPLLSKKRHICKVLKSRHGTESDDHNKKQA